MTKFLKSNLIILLVMSCLLAGGCAKSKSVSNAGTTQATTGDTADVQSTIDEKVAATSSSDRLYVIQSIESANEQIFCHSVTTGKELKYKYSLSTQFLDADGKSCSSLKFVPGTVVTFGDFLPRNGAVSCVQIAEGYWSQDDIKRFSIDEERGVFKIGSTNYKITDNTFVFSDKEEIKLSDISENDILRVFGRDKEIISVAVTTGHGIVRIYNSELFVDSVICIGNKHMAYIDGDMEIEVPEGTYEITVANNGWGGSAEYEVVRGETTEVDLDELKGDGPSYCKLTFEVTVPGTTVYLDNKVVDTDEPQEVRYGRHLLKVSATGYTDWSRTLIVNSKSATISLDFSDEKQSESASGSTSGSTGGSTNTTGNTGGTGSSSGSTSGSTGSTTGSTTGNSTGSSSSGSTSSSATTSNSNPELDYLTTLSDLLTNML